MPKEISALQKAQEALARYDQSVNLLIEVALWSEETKKKALAEGENWVCIVRQQAMKVRENYISHHLAIQYVPFDQRGIVTGA